MAHKQRLLIRDEEGRKDETDNKGESFMTPMTTKKRFYVALTVLMFVAVTGFVIGCDSDDGPKVTPPSGGGSGTTPTRNTTAETQGREGLEETDNGSMIRNTGEVALNVRFAYDEPKHYRLNVNTAMPSDPASAGNAPARVACGVPATGRANNQCFNNDRSEVQSAPTPYQASGNGDNGNGDNGGSGNGQNQRWDNSINAKDCLEYYTEGTGATRHRVRNTCGRTIVANSFGVACSTNTLTPLGTLNGISTYQDSSVRLSVLQLEPGENGWIQGVDACSGSLVGAACYGTFPNQDDTVQPFFTSSDASSYGCWRATR